MKDYLPETDVWIKAETDAGEFHLHRSPGGWGGYNDYGDWRFFHPSQIKSWSLLDPERPDMSITWDDIAWMALLVVFVAVMIFLGVKAGGLA